MTQKEQRGRERALELFKMITDTRVQLSEWESELDTLLPGGHSKTKRPPKKERAESKAATTPDTKARNGRGALTSSIRAAISKMHGEFTSTELITAAGVPESQNGSAFAAISRLAAKGEEIVKGTTRGKFRRASQGVR
jgi:hypothetical protein